nr:amorphane sesquiterpene synthase [Stachybotrys sp.]
MTPTHSSEKAERQVSEIDEQPEATTRHPGGILYHLQTLFLFTKSDFKTVIFPQTIFTISSVISGIDASKSQCIFEIAKRFPLLVFVLWSHLLLENFSNQRLPGAVIEDKVNKPWRPIPSGRITPEKTQTILRFAVLIVILMDTALGMYVHSVTAMTMIWLYNDLDGSGGTTLERNLINAVGLAWYGWAGLTVMLGSGQESSCPLDSQIPYKWIGLMTTVVITTVHAQDHPDIEGDRQRGRRTIPLIYGQRVSRWSLATLLVVWSVVCPIFCDPSTLVMWVLPMAIGGTMAFLTLTRWDHDTNELVWKLWCLWVCILYALPAFSNSPIQ